MSVFGLPYLTFVIVNLFFKKQHKAHLEEGAQLGTQEHRIPQSISGKLLFLILGAITEAHGQNRNPAMLILTFIDKYSNWTVRTYFKSASVTEFPQCWGRGLSISDDHIALAVTEDRRNHWAVVFISSHSCSLWLGFLWILSLLWHDRPVKYLLLMLAFCLLLGLLFLATETGGSGTWSWK